MEPSPSEALTSLSELEEQIFQLERKLAGKQKASHIPELKLLYFDAPGRAEAIRQALFVGGIDFVDERMAGADWPAIKPTTPFEAVPVLFVDGKPLAESNAILSYVGHLSGLMPGDPFSAAKVQEVLSMLEGFGTTFAKTDFSVKAWPRLAGFLLKILKENGNTGFFVGNSLTVADLKVINVMKFIVSGFFAHIPSNLLDSQPELKKALERIEKHEKLQAYAAQKK
eukprot:m.74133 g.74133  ORF g.74133 m.74133 type:complete len:226 (+) comp17077_c0_seq2:1169-1846(+)